MFLKSLGIALLTLFVCNVSWASGTSLQGTVKAPNGKPIKGADVRVEGKVAKVVKTDSNGKYACSDLPAGTYRVTLSVSGAVKASITNATTKQGEVTQLNFDLKQTGAAGTTTAKKKTHMVYMPSDTGSHMGGRWVEVDDEGNLISGAGTDNVKKAGNDAVRAMQNGSR